MENFFDIDKATTFEEIVEIKERAYQINKNSGIHIERILSGLYKNPTHCIFELLQNAEDAKANSVQITLDDDKLIFRHNGRPFDLRDIKGITGVDYSSKTDDITQIGRFGIGFKAVFCICEAPEIYSDNYNFRITNFYVPEKIGEALKEQNADETELKTNQRFEKLTRLEQLGVYVDEAHHMFGKDLEKSISSLRQTINDLNLALKQNNTQIVGCYNFTGTPYVENSVLPEVIYYYGLKDAIHKAYLKNADILGFDNVKSHEFLKTVIKDFWAKYGHNTYEDLPPKLAIFGATVEEVTDEIKPVVEEVLVELGIDRSKILVNVGDTAITKDSDIKCFNNLDVLGTEGSQKQFILLCGKGREGWNCRSLFGVALFRSPKSKIFVLQATMRRLRQITEEQQMATIYISKDNYNILNDELQKNFRVTIKDMKSSEPKKQEYKVHLLKEKTIKIKYIERKYTLIEKEYSVPISFGLDSLDLERYKTYIREEPSLVDDRMETKTEATDIKDTVKYSPFMIVGELSRYLNIKCSLAQRILDECEEGADKVAKFVSAYNELLYDVVITKVFETLNEVKSEIKTYDKEVPLLRLPEGKDFYTFNALPELVNNVEDTQFQISQNGSKVADKSFHTDNYCFDSKPEQQCFLQYIFSNKVKEVYFTGMFTSQYNGLGIQYIDPETNVIRSYYPDFITTLEDGTIEIIEVKGDNMIEDSVVKAKADAAAEMAKVSKITYRMIPSTKIMNEKVI